MTQEDWASRTSSSPKLLNGPSWLAAFKRAHKRIHPTSLRCVLRLFPAVSSKPADTPASCRVAYAMPMRYPRLAACSLQPFSAIVMSDWSTRPVSASSGSRLGCTISSPLIDSRSPASIWLSISVRRSWGDLALICRHCLGWLDSSASR